MKRLARFLAAGLIAMALPSAEAQEASPTVDPKEIPEKDWELVKNSAAYSIADDKWFAEVTKLATTKPAYPPGTGIGDGGSGSFGSLDIKPTDPKAARQKWFEIGMAYSVADWDRQGNPINRLKRFSLVECTRKGDLTRERFIGLYTSEPWIKKVVTEVLRQSSAIREPAKPKLPDGRWVIQKTVFRSAWMISDRALYDQVVALLPARQALGKPEDYEPWASVVVDGLPATIAPATRVKSDLKLYRVGIYKDGRMKIAEVNDKDVAETTSRDLGWFQSPQIWNRLRLKVVSWSDEIGENPDGR
jgi:hypothetical protein